MEDASITFILNGISLKMQANKNDTLKDIFKKYSIKIEKDIKTLLFLYHGKKINEDLKVKDIDNTNENITILVDDNFVNNEQGKKIKFSKFIICPICEENCYIDINNYKISLSNCINNHNIKNINFDELKDKMEIKHSKIFCNNCNKNKNEVFNQEFYTCLDCKINLCPLCNLSHNKNKKHNIIKYDMINYICLTHLEKYLVYCKDCDKNLCGLCGIEHNRKHEIINLKEMLNKDIDKNLNEFRESIENFKSHLNEIIIKITKIIDNLEIFYKMNEEIINNYDFKNNNYQIIKNINTINDYDKTIIEDINKIILENKSDIKLKYIDNLYEEMMNKNNTNRNFEEDICEDEQNNTIENNKDENQGNLDKKNEIDDKDLNEINIYNDKKELKDKCNNDKNDEQKINKDNEEKKVDEKDDKIIEKKINDNKDILSNNYNKEEQFSEITIKYNITKKKEVKLFGSDFVKNNKNYCSILIGEKKFELMDYLKLNTIDIDSDKILEIKLFCSNNITDMSFMFHKCSCLISLPDISNINTSNVTHMNSLFSGCESLYVLPGVLDWDTSNVIDMSYLFYKCSLLKRLPDISKWNTSKVTSFYSMFGYCASLTYLPDLSEWDTSNVTTMSWMFYICPSLKSLPDISKWNTSKVTEMGEMFLGNQSLKSLPDISNWDVSNVINLGAMFAHCKSLSSLPDLSKWDSNKAIKTSIFQGCNPSLNIPENLKSNCIIF